MLGDCFVFSVGYRPGWIIFTSPIAGHLSVPDLGIYWKTARARWWAGGLFWTGSDFRSRGRLHVSEFLTKKMLCAKGGPCKPFSELSGCSMLAKSKRYLPCSSFGGEYLFHKVRVVECIGQLAGVWDKKERRKESWTDAFRFQLGVSWEGRVRSRWSTIHVFGRIQRIRYSHHSLCMGAFLTWRP